MNIQIVLGLLMALVILGGCRSIDSKTAPEGKVTFAQSDPPAPAAQDGSSHDWKITVRPLPDESGEFTFEAALTHSHSKSDSGDWGAVLTNGSDALSIPKMTIAAGEEANLEIEGPDGRPALAARVSVDPEGRKLNYWVMIRSEKGTHSSAAEIDLSPNQLDAGDRE